MRIKETIHKKLIRYSKWYRNKNRSHLDWDYPVDKNFPVYPKIKEKYSYTGWEYFQTKIGKKYYRLSTSYESIIVPPHRLEFEVFDFDKSMPASHVGNNIKGNPLTPFAYLQWETAWDERYYTREEMMLKYNEVKNTLEVIVMEEEL